MVNRRQLLLSGLAGLLPSGSAVKALTAEAIHQTALAKVKVTLVAAGLDHPWSIAFLPNGSALVSERPGRLLRIAMNGRTSAPIKGVPQVAAVGQGGLLDLALSPTFAKDRLVFMTFAEPRTGGNGTAVGRAKLSSDLRSLTGFKVIWRQYPTYDGSLHFGSRLVFDRQGNLFVTVGERSVLRDQAQNPRNSLGKIIHITANGGVPANNPKKAGWLPRLWSIGHRNPQGAAIHPVTGELWTVEHGAKGGDELNRPRAGRNYGWPLITHGTNYDGTPIGVGSSKPGMEQPVKYWVPSIAPSGLCFYSGRNIPAWKGNLFLGALAGQHLERLTLSGRRAVGEERLFQGLGRIRDVCEGPDGNLYFLTDADVPNGALYRISPA
jgi:aldose sugar dehydrogenase